MNIPLSTYRIQFHSQYTFDSALQDITYLRELGISHIYASPIFKAKKGSMHGYDVIDPKEINPELGGKEKLSSLLSKAKACSIGWIQDIVPNHMAYDSENAYLMDVLEKGQNSPYVDFFAIDWDNPYEDLKGRLLAPFLGEFYGTCLDKREIQVQFEKGGFFLHYNSIDFPVKIEEYPFILKLDLSQLEQKIGKESDGFSQFLSLVQNFEKLRGEANSEERTKRIVALKSSLNDMIRSHPQISDYINAMITRLNGEKGNPSSFNELDNFHSRQNFRFSYWKVSNEELNYRRFFTVNTLISLKMEKQEVFDFVHTLLFSLLQEFKIDGIRIDHLDGLSNPLEYQASIRKRVPNTYIIAEKILNLFETLPEGIGLQGTTGYDFLNILNGIFVERKNDNKFTTLYTRFTKVKLTYPELVIQKKKMFMERCLAGDIYNLAKLLKKIIGISRYGRDMTVYGLKRALFEILAVFPTYRTYVARDTITKRDEEYIQHAVASAKETNQTLKYELDLLERILLLRYGNETPEKEKQEWYQLASRFQQISCALMAKGMEDTVFYVYNRLLSLNEVGGNPSIFGISLDDFHIHNAHVARDCPSSLNATATHDTKRGEDVRARLNVLSEMPQEWANFLKECTEINKSMKKALFGMTCPDKNEEYFIYQTLVGAYPFSQEEIPSFKERLKRYVVKAFREGKEHTSWNNPDSAYEEACVNFVDGLFARDRFPHFFNHFRSFQKKIAFYGVFNSLSQVLLKVTSPGVPDFFQGTELWDFSLVDPDNRKLIDFEKRKAILQEIQRREENLPDLIRELLDHREDGRIKLFTIYRLLKARNNHKELFQNGDYLPLAVQGEFREHCLAFARRYQQSYCLVLTPRFLSKMVREEEYPLGIEVWKETQITLPSDFPCTWTNILTGKTFHGNRVLPLGESFDHFPGALLISNNRTRA